MRLCRQLQALLAGATFAAATFLYTGSTVQLGDNYYFIDAEVAGTIPWPGATASNSSLALVPVTVVADAAQASNLQRLVDDWLAKDDVFHEAFLKNGVFSNGIAAGSSSSSCARHDLPPGPYFANPVTGQVHRVYRLYDDFSNSFTASVLQKLDGSFETLSAQMPAVMSLTIGVPSRLYYTRTKKQPLAGVRIGVKDLYSLKGVKRSNGNRAWYHLYPPSEETSPAIQRLIDAGAVVVGYQGLAQFANGDKFTGDWVDFHSPFNPRGDGYQTPLGSSSGAGSSIASYEWLDVAVGSDTGGSVRNPAQIAGVFGNRPTHGAASLDLVTPLAPTLDTAGLLVRDPWLWDAASVVMYGGNYTSLADAESVAYPSKVFAFSSPGMGVNETATGNMLAKFTSAVGRLADTEVEMLDMDELWNKTRPEALEGTSLLQLLNATYVVLTTMEQSRLVRDPFFTDYAAKHNGRKPYINPSARDRWTFADTLPQSELDAAYKNQTILADWFTTHVLAKTNDSSCSSALLLYPGLLGKPIPRDTYRGGPSPLPYGLYSSRYSSFSGTPDIALPIGETTFMSNVTGMEELLPVSVDVMAARGCDGLLTRLAMDLVREGVIDLPKTGRDLDGAEVLFKREAIYGI